MDHQCKIASAQRRPSTSLAWMATSHMDHQCKIASAQKRPLNSLVLSCTFQVDHDVKSVENCHCAHIFGCCSMDNVHSVAHTKGLEGLRGMCDVLLHRCHAGLSDLCCELLSGSVQG